MIPAIPQFFIMKIGFLRPFIGQLLNPGHFFSLAFTLFNPLLQSICDRWILMKIVVELFSNKITYELSHTGPLHIYVHRPKFCFGLGFKDGFDHSYRNSSYDTRTDVRSIEVFFIEFPNSLRIRFPECLLMSTTLC